MDIPSHLVADVQLRSPTGDWQLVGHLIYNNETTRFESASEYWELPQRCVLGQIFEDNERDWQPSQRVAIPTWFSHLLPEGYLRSAAAMATKVNLKREFPLLMALGEDDLPGALRVVASDSDRAGPPTEDAPPPEDDHDVSEDPVLKFSLAGLQPKFSVLLQQDKGLTIPSKGQAGDWIAKLPDGRPGFDGVPRAEMASLELARHVGIDVPETFLINVSEISGLPLWARDQPGQALAIKRFDRLPRSGRVHAEVFAQILNVPTANDRLKYRRANFETIGSLTAAICGDAAAYEVIDRIVLNVLIGNGDAHLKNWAIIYPDGVNAALSPLYDVVPTVLYIPDDDLGLKLNSSRNFKAVNLESFDRLALRAGLETAVVRQRILRMIDAVEAEWNILREFLTSDQLLRLTAWRDSLPLFRAGASARG
ncbi:type II toxin-antitoxin system HipA family toxin [Dactylosporangium sp. NPDC048998]|uniref:type II toxin-antitoxin system HipA family toxin n=1 Tax=Dactylosporangium sp. NPDC048998 TaxID=3363976 RepID=UPI0037218FE9